MNEELLRRALEARAERVEVEPDALGTIRTRIAGRRRDRWRLGVGLSSAAVTLVTAAVVGFVSCGPPAIPPPNPPASPSDGPTAGPTSAPILSGRVPVYYAGPQLRLYREFRTVTLSSGTLVERIRAGVVQLLVGGALDGDYRTLWPGGAAVRSVTLDGNVAIVDLAGASTSSVDAPTAQAAVQQVVWTVTAVAADQGMQLQGVRLRFDGAPAPNLWGHVAAAGTLVRAPALDTLANVWLISPQEGDVVNATFDVHIDGAVFEGAAQLRVRDAFGREVRRQPVQLSVGAPARGEVHVSLTLPPGSYTLEAYAVSERDSTEHSLDNHHITVR
jgi:hypothetical protein